MVPHEHLILRAEVNKPLVDPIDGIQWLLRLVKSIGMNITEHGGPHVDYVDKPGNKGLAGIVMIETSHIAMHVWDRERPALAQIDVYSCKHYDHIKVVKAVEEMNPSRIQWHRINRREEIKLMESVDRMC